MLWPELPLFLFTFYFVPHVVAEKNLCESQLLNRAILSENEC